MDIISLCPLRAASLVWSSSPGLWTFTVVCKATYRLAPELSPLDEKQEPPNEEDSHWDDDPNRSLSSPSDLVPFKARTDVLLVGHAFAPGKRAVRSLVARMIVGEVDKSIEVFCKRVWGQDGQLREGPGFSSMPLVYERAAGGPDTWNPVGVRGDAASDAYGNVAIPNLLPAGMMLAKRGDFVPPVGFGPIAPTWALRVDRLGRHRGAFSVARWSDRVVPEDLDPGCFNAAPKDQQVEGIRSDERLVLENLHPEYPRLVTSLPGIRPRVFAEKSGAAPGEIGMRCDTLWIDTDRGICTLTWRGHVPLEGREEAGRVLVAMEEQGKRVTWADVVRMSVARGRDVGAQGQGEGQAQGQGEDGFDALSTARIAGGTETATLSPEMVAKAALPFPEQVGGAGRVGVPQRGVGDAGLPFVPVTGAAAGEVSGGVVAPPPMVRALVTSEPIAPPMVVSPWAAQQAAAPTVGQLAPFSPNVPPPPIGGSAAAGAGASRAETAGERGSRIAARPVPEALPDGKPKPTVGPELGSGPTGKEAVLGGAVAASNAAARSAQVGAAAKPVEAAAKPDAKAAAREKPREVLELIWYEPAALPRLRRHLAWKKIIAELKPRPSDDDFDAGLPPEQMKAAKDKRDVFGVLARGEVQDMAGIRRAMEMAIADDGSFVPPYVLTEGVLEFPFDELETLKAMMVVIAPFVPGDKKLKETIDLVREVLKTPGIERAREVAEGLIARVKEAFEQGSRGISVAYVESQVESILLDGRHYHRRTAMGGTWIRSLMKIAGATDTVTLYLPDDTEKSLPILRQFAVKAIAEARICIKSEDVTAFDLVGLTIGRRLSRTQCEQLDHGHLPRRQ